MRLGPLQIRLNRIGLERDRTAVGLDRDKDLSFGERLVTLDDQPAVLPIALNGLPGEQTRKAEGGQHHGGEEGSFHGVATDSGDPVKVVPPELAQAKS